MTEDKEETKAQTGDEADEVGTEPATPEPLTADKIIQAAREKKAKEEAEATSQKSWWWGVIPAVLAVGLLLFWLTGQYEEMFGIDPRGTWKGHSKSIISGADENPDIPVPPSEMIRWEMLIEDIAGELWVKIYMNRDEVLAGPVTIEENAILYKDELGYFHGIYLTHTVRFRYNPFARRFIDAVIQLRSGESHSVTFERE